MKILKDVSLANLTTLGIGGAARFYAEAESADDIADAVHLARENGWRLFVLGGGSNIVVADKGFDGLVLRIVSQGTKHIYGNEYEDALEVAAGENWDEFVSFAVENDLQGVECLSGIPGTVGATPIQNVGAYGQDVSQTIESLNAFDLQNLVWRTFSNEECRFAYRQSLFNTIGKDRFIISKVVFRLRKKFPPLISYRDLQKLFGEKQPNLREVREAVLQIRRAKSMVIDANDPNSKSVGSFFKNPLVDESKFAEILDVAREKGIGEVPFFASEEGKVKIPAAWLMEQSGLTKGFVFGRVGLSQNHSLAIINRGGASASDILEFKKFIQQKVFETFAVEIFPEPLFIE